MSRLLLAPVLAALFAPGLYALGTPHEPAAIEVARVVEIELRWLGAQPGFHRYRHSVAEMAAVREGLRRALLHAHADREVVNRVLQGAVVDLGETPLEFGERLAARARGLGPHGAQRWGAVTAAAARAFALGRVRRAGIMAWMLQGDEPAPSLPGGFDFTRAPYHPPGVLPAWMLAGQARDDLPRPLTTDDPELDLQSTQVLKTLSETVATWKHAGAAGRGPGGPTVTGGSEMDRLAAQVLHSLSKAVTSQAAAYEGPVYRAGSTR